LLKMLARKFRDKRRERIFTTHCHMQVYHVLRTTSLSNMLLFA